MVRIELWLGIRTQPGIEPRSRLAIQLSGVGDLGIGSAPDIERSLSVEPRGRRLIIHLSARLGRRFLPTRRLTVSPGIRSLGRSFEPAP
ncbi:hypothetical protein DFR70_101295 [Nocardia tenerifensis]|uniref:Uncharacterized protein n=1 Tax=Nocardia tenerifensis TaxID=228006 RepID=A0A318KYF5_9NOCA|nr:hypothetical protein DFR70_101295 [Nocardia tenerifensis]